MQLQRILTKIGLNSVPILLLCFCFFGFWHLWKRVCVTQRPQRDLPVLVLIPFLSPLMLGITWWHIPEQGGNWNIWVIVLPLMVSTAMLSYSVYSMHKRRYRLLSTLAMLVSAPVAFLECIAGSVLMVFGRAN